jgi:hypothetical protein
MKNNFFLKMEDVQELSTDKEMLSKLNNFLELENNLNSIFGGYNNIAYNDIIAYDKIIDYTKTTFVNNLPSPRP